MIRINRGADLEGLFGGQHDFEVSVTISDANDMDIIGAGHTVAEAVAEARETMRGWRADDAEECDACGYTVEDGHCECDQSDEDREQAMREHMAEGRAEMGGAW